MITGKKTRLRAIERDDLELIQKWMNDEEVMWFWGTPSNTPSLEEIEELLSKLRRSGGNNQFMIEMGSIPIGIIVTSHLFQKHQRADMGILIGEKGQWDRGYGTDALITYLNYLFNELGLHRVTLQVQDYNPRAIKCYERCGFIKEGILREQAFVKGKFCDRYAMGVLRDEFNKLHKL